MSWPGLAWIDEDDPQVNPRGTKGIGELGSVGTAAASANAVDHATGDLVRDLPSPLDLDETQGGYQG
jgi:xanthine dehydrogenase YagR molybdenum-binding subunit